jgi:hypothetical protein
LELSPSSIVVDHTVSNGGRRHVFKARTEKPFALFKQQMTAELNSKWANFMATYTWRGNTVHVRNPGAVGFVRLDEGILHVELNLESWPATLPWVSPLIVRDLRTMTETLARS